MEEIVEKIITPKSDVIFKNIFGKEKNIKLLESLLESILGKRKKVVSTIKSKELDIENVTDKVGVLDVQAILEDGTILDIEMQNKNYAYYNKRILFYASKLISSQVETGEQYTEIKDVILINILDYEIPWMKNYISKYEINSMDENNKKVKGLTIYFIQLPRFERERKLLEKNVKYEDIVKTKLDEWCVYFSYKNMEVLEMVKVKNMDIEEAVKLYDELQKRKDVVHLHFSRMMAEMDNKARLKYAVEKAEEKALKKGTAAGIETGMRTGMQVGKQAEKEEIIKNLLRQKVDLDVIIKATGVTKDKIDEIMELSKAS